MCDIGLTDWVRVDKNRFNNINNRVKRFKDKNTCFTKREWHSYLCWKRIPTNKILKKLEEVNQNQLGTLNTLLIAAEIFIGEVEEYRIIDGEYRLTKPKSSQEESRK